MNAEKFSQAMGEVDSKFVDEAINYRKKVVRSSLFKRWCAIAACFALVLVSALFWLRHQRNYIALSGNSSNVTAYYTDNPFISSASSESLVELTEEELFTTFYTAIFRGTVSEIRNIALNFNGETEYRALAEIEIEKVYRGPYPTGDSVSVLLPCPLIDGFEVTDTSTVSAMEVGTTGIFMPMIFDDESAIWKQNGAILDKRDIADCGFADGERYVFIETEEGLVFSRTAYSSIRNATTLDEVEDYIETMLENLGNQQAK